MLNDGSSKTLMVDERQSVRDVLDNLFEKTHCDCNVDWSLCETNAELHLGESRQNRRWLGERDKEENTEEEVKSGNSCWLIQPRRLAVFDAVKR